MSDRVLAVVGPTASGKSSIAIQLAQKFKGQIISGDSIQIYRHFDIGSAKTPIEQRQNIPHWLIDELEPNQPFNVCLFQTKARQAIKEISAQKDLPIVAGGTGLYIKALLYDYTFSTTQTLDVSVYADLTTEDLYQKLCRQDLLAAEKIGPHNRQRILRAVAMADSGHLKSDQEAGQQHQLLYDAKLIGLTMPKEELHQRINQRVDLMISAGLKDEVKQLSEQLGWDILGMKGIGYKEFKEYFSGQQTLQQTAELIKLHTRQFAKRQYTWWRHQLPVEWYDVTTVDYQAQIIKDVELWLK